MMRATITGLALVLIGLSAAGCAPTHFVEGVQYTAERHGVGSAAALGVAQHGYLRFDAGLLSDLNDALQLQDRDALRHEGGRILQAAHTLAVTTTEAEIDRLPPAALDELVRRYQLTAAPADVAARRQFLKDTFAAESRVSLDAAAARLASSESADDTRHFLQAIRRAIEPAAGDRGKVARALLAAPLFLPATIGAEVADAEAARRLVTADFKHVALYEPPGREGPPDAAQLESATPAALAGWYAPVFVQQVDPGAAYAAESDQVGRVLLTGVASDVVVHVDPAHPVVYWAHREAKVGARRYDQLIYVAWYPERPAMVASDPSAGRTDGVVLRITLDRHHRPAIYEFVRSCGCYHTLWVSEFVEAAARAEFGLPKGDEHYAIQRANVRRELFIPELVADDGAQPHRPIAFVDAGYHLLTGVRPLADEPPAATVAAKYAYVLEPYENLTRLPLGDGVASMFGSDGLVHNAGRAEGWLLAPTGLLSAGQPRQLGTMKIRMDAYDYDDPRLLERNLRLPSDF